MQKEMSCGQSHWLNLDYITEKLLVRLVYKKATKYCLNLRILISLFNITVYIRVWVDKFWTILGQNFINFIYTRVHFYDAVYVFYIIWCVLFVL